MTNAPETDQTAAKGISDHVQNQNHKKTVSETYQQDKPRKNRHAHTSSTRF